MVSGQKVDIVGCYGETETNPNDCLGVFYAKTPITDRLDFKSSLHYGALD